MGIHIYELVSADIEGRFVRGFYIETPTRKFGRAKDLVIIYPAKVTIPFDPTGRTDSNPGGEGIYLAILGFFVFSLFCHPKQCAAWTKTVRLFTTRVKLLWQRFTRAIGPLVTEVASEGDEEIT
jgi:hypothetical protein